MKVAHEFSVSTSFAAQVYLLLFSLYYYVYVLVDPRLLLL